MPTGPSDAFRAVMIAVMVMTPWRMLRTPLSLVAWAIGSEERRDMTGCNSTVVSPVPAGTLLGHTICPITAKSLISLASRAGVEPALPP